MFYAYKTKESEGICDTWAECEKRVKGKSGAKYKKFTSEKDARDFLKGLATEDTIELDFDKIPDGHAICYVDGSYNVETNEYGYGICCLNHDGYWIDKGKGKCLYGGRNVEGEVAAAYNAIKYIIDNKLYTSVVIVYDYEGVGKWADHSWKANKPYTIAYAEFIEKAKECISITLKHVDGHTGNFGNEMVDKLAKIACGVTLSSSDKAFINKYHDELYI